MNPEFDPASIDEAYVRRAAALAGIHLTPEQVPGVIEHFRRTARAASLIDEFPLDQATGELGPVWRL